VQMQNRGSGTWPWADQKRTAIRWDLHRSSSSWRRYSAFRRSVCLRRLIDGPGSFRNVPRRSPHHWVVLRLRACGLISNRVNVGSASARRGESPHRVARARRQYRGLSRAG
jgi:hypothetical protein